MVLPSSPKAERDKTVAAKDGGCGRSSQWWDSNEADAQPEEMFPCAWGFGEKYKHKHLPSGQ